jgi:NAD(+) diphosphatase
MTSSPEHTPADTHAPVDTHTPRYLLISREGETLLSDDGTLHYLTGIGTAEPLTEEAILARSVIRPAAYGADAQKNSEAEVHVLYCEDETLAQVAADLNDPRVRASTSGFRYYPVHDDPEGRAHYATALARRDYLIDMRYSAYSGEEAPLGSKGIRRTASGEMVFPRIDPAVMALVTSRDGERVLLANNRQWHPNRFALIAGFVDPGENLEEAIAREVYEETGLHALSTEYRMSDVWPFPRSLMICYRVRVDENEPIIHHDGEIRAARWFTAAELREAIAISEERGNSDEDDPAKLELPGTNAVARRMIDEWLAEKP